MRKLLTMLSVTTITSTIMPLTIACKVKSNRYNVKPAQETPNEKPNETPNEKPNDADKIKRAVEALSKIENEEVEVLGPFASLLYTLAMKVADSIKTLQKYIDALKEVTLLGNNLILKNSDGNVLNSTDVVELDHVITVEGTVQSGVVKGAFKFTVKVKEKITDIQKLANVVLKIESLYLKDFIIPRNGVDVATFKDQIKNLPGFTDIIGKDGVTLRNDLILTNSETKTILGSNAIIFPNQSIIVEGIVQAGIGKIEEKNFTFTVKVKWELTDIEKLDNAVLKIETTWDGKFVRLGEPIYIANDTNLRKEIKKYLDITDVIDKDWVKLKKDFTIDYSKVSFEDDGSVHSSSWIIVEGKVQSGIEKRTFKFMLLVE